MNANVIKLTTEARNALKCARNRKYELRIEGDDEEFHKLESTIEALDVGATVKLYLTEKGQSAVLGDVWVTHCGKGEHKVSARAPEASITDEEIVNDPESAPKKQRGLKMVDPLNDFDAESTPAPKVEPPLKTTAADPTLPSSVTSVYASSIQNAEDLFNGVLKTSRETSGFWVSKSYKREQDARWAAKEQAKKLGFTVEGEIDTEAGVREFKRA